jgi:hypothetical protein
MALSDAIENAKLEFAKRHAMEPADPRTLEAFFTDCVLRHRNMSPFQAQQSWSSEHRFLIGGAQDAQLDAIAIFLNGSPLRPGDDLSHLEQLASDDAGIDLSFIFVQATGRTMSGAPLTQKMATFGAGVYGFLDPSASPSIGINASLQAWVGLKSKIFEILDENDRTQCCECAMYFVSPRSINVDDNISRAIDTAKSAIANHKHIADKFYNIEFTEMGADKIEAILREEREPRPQIAISTDTFVPLPPIAGVGACYIGYLTATQLLGLIAQTFEDGDQQIKSSMFNANVRAFMGLGGRVNASIAGTLADEQKRAQFALRSNGIAIVAEGQRRLPEGGLALLGAQIVNGCQTSHTLFYNRHHLQHGAGDRVCIPVKIIVTADKSIENAAILGLNRQTPIEETQVFSDKNKVDLLAASFRDEREPAAGLVLFEARTDEYKGRAGIDPDRIVNLYDLLYAGSAAFYRTPELTARQSRDQIMSDLQKGEILSHDVDVTAYHLCGLMIVHARKAVAAHHKKRWQQYAMKNMLLYCMRLLMERHLAIPEPPRTLHAPEARAYFEQLRAVMTDPTLAPRVAERAVEVVVGSCANAKLKMTADNARKRELAAEVRRQVAKFRQRGLAG